MPGTVSGQGLAGGGARHHFPAGAWPGEVPGTVSDRGLARKVPGTVSGRAWLGEVPGTVTAFLVGFSSEGRQTPLSW